MLLVILTISMLPCAVFAKGTQERAAQPVSVDVYNHTGSALTILLTNKNTGLRSYINLGTGVTTEILSQGLYDYSVTTLCGFEAGTWNVTPGRILFISCRESQPVINLFRPEVTPLLCGFSGYHGSNFGKLWFILLTQLKKSC